MLHFCLPDVVDLMQVRFRSWSLCQTGLVGYGIKLVLLSDNGSCARLSTAGAGQVQVLPNRTRAGLCSGLHNRNGEMMHFVLRVFEHERMFDVL